MENSKFIRGGVCRLNCDITSKATAQSHNHTDTRMTNGFTFQNLSVHSAELWCVFVLARDGNYRPVDKKSITGKILLLLLPQIPFVPVCVMCVWRFFFCLSLSQIHVRCACDGATPHWSYTVVAIVTALGVCVYYARRYYSHIIITICE